MYAILLSGCENSSTESKELVPLPGRKVADERVWAVANAMGPGVNFGGMLEAPHEGEWGLRAEVEYINLAWSAGFRTIRLPIRWSNHTATTFPFAIDPRFMDRVAEVVDHMLEIGFHVVINMHHHKQLDGDDLDPGEFAVVTDVLTPRFVSMWGQISARFANRSDRLIFELYNEPHGRLTATTWNDLLDTTLKKSESTTLRELWL